MWYLKWSEPYCIVVMIGTGIGMLLLIFSFSFFILHRDKHIIKNTFIFSCVMKFSLIVSFAGVILFLGKPCPEYCMAQQAMYGLGFTLCVSCILTKAFRTFIAHVVYDPPTQHKLLKIDKPLVIVGLLTAIQGLICIFWFVFDHPGVEEMESKSQPLTMNRLCTQGAFMFCFGVMHVYMAVLAVVCFLLAFKGRDDETEPIVFSMLIHLFAWLCFIPVFITQHELRPIIQISAIMVSNYGVIFCHFTPKWFTIISEKMEHNNALKVTSGQSAETFSDSALGSASLRSSVEPLPLPCPLSCTADGETSGSNSITIPITISSDQLTVADDEMSDVHDVLYRVSSEVFTVPSVDHTVQFSTAESDMPRWFHRLYTISIRRRRTRSF